MIQHVVLAKQRPNLLGIHCLSVDMQLRLKKFLCMVLDCKVTLQPYYSWGNRNHSIANIQWSLDFDSRNGGFTTTGAKSQSNRVLMGTATLRFVQNQCWLYATTKLWRLQNYFIGGLIRNINILLLLFKSLRLNQFKVGFLLLVILLV